MQVNEVSIESLTNDNILMFWQQQTENVANTVGLHQLGEKITGMACWKDQAVI